MIWILTVTTLIEYEYEKEEDFFFLSEEDALKMKEEHLKSVLDDNGHYIPNITDVIYNLDELTFDEFKSVATVNDYEKLFGVNIDTPEALRGV